MLVPAGACDTDICIDALGRLLGCIVLRTFSLYLRLGRHGCRLSNGNDYVEHETMDHRTPALQRRRTCINHVHIATALQRRKKSILILLR